MVAERSEDGAHFSPEIEEEAMQPQPVVVVGLEERMVHVLTPDDSLAVRFQGSRWGQLTALVELGDSAGVSEIRRKINGHGGFRTAAELEGDRKAINERLGQEIITREDGEEGVVYSLAADVRAFPNLEGVDLESLRPTVVERDEVIAQPEQVIEEEPERPVVFDSDASTNSAGNEPDETKEEEEPLVQAEVIEGEDIAAGLFGGRTIRVEEDDLPVVRAVSSVIRSSRTEDTAITTREQRAGSEEQQLESAAFVLGSFTQDVLGKNFHLPDDSYLVLFSNDVLRERLQTLRETRNKLSAEEVKALKASSFLSARHAETVKEERARALQRGRELLAAPVEWEAWQGSEDPARQILYFVGRVNQVLDEKFAGAIPMPLLDMVSPEPQYFEQATEEVRQHVGDTDAGSIYATTTRKQNVWRLSEIGQRAYDLATSQ